MGNSEGARLGRLGLAVALAALFAALIAGCGGSSSSSSETASTGSETASAGGSGEAVGNQAALEKVIAEYELEPTAIGAKLALAKQPKAGEAIIFLECDVTQCAQQGSGIKDAAESVGWRYESQQFKTADPSTLITGMKEALAKDPVAVVFSGTPEELWSQMIPAYEKAGVALIPLFVGPAKIKGPVIASIGGRLENEVAGKVLADWFIVNSEGGGSAVIQGVAGFPAVTLWVEQFEAEVAKECSGCSVEAVEVTTAELAEGSSTATTLSALQRNSSAKYVFAYNGNFVAGLSTELENAGLGDVKVGTYAATSDYVAEAADGKDYALMADGNTYSGWLAADIAMLHAEGAKVKPEEELLPVQLLTMKSATPELAEMANDYQLPVNYKEEFKKLWGAE